jgi:hypothetical protein
MALEQRSVLDLNMLGGQIAAHATLAAQLDSVRSEQIPSERAMHEYFAGLDVCLDAPVRADHNERIFQADITVHFAINI